MIGAHLPAAAAPGSATTARVAGYTPEVPRPAIVNALMRNATAPKYRADIAAYSLRHYGVFTSALQPKAVVLHFTVSDAGSWQALINTWDVPDASGSNTGGEQPQPAAHFIVEQDGTIYQTMPLDLMVRHAYGVNDSAIGIEFVERSSAGNVLNRPAQLSAGLALVRWLQFEFGIPAANIMGHGTVNSHPLFHDLTGNRNDHTDWNTGEVARFRSALGDVPVKNGGPVGGSITKVRVGPPNATVFGNLIAVRPQAAGYTSVFDCSRGRPTATLTSIFGPQVNTPVMAMAQTDANGDICVFTSAQTHLVWDLYYAGAALTAHPAIRHLNTFVATGQRPSGPVPGGQSVEIQTGKPNETIMGTLTAWGPASDGHMRVYPCSGGLPKTSNLNYVARSLTSNFVTVRSDEAGRICIYTTATSHLLWDQTGENTQPSAHAGVRRYDARLPVTGDIAGNGGRRIEPGSVVRIKAADASATVFGNLTVTNALHPGHTVVYPCDATKPGTSVNNFLANRNNSSAAMVRTDPAGWICIQTSAAAHLIWDQFAESTTIDAPAAPRRLLDTRN